MCGVCGFEVEPLPHNYEVWGLIPGNRVLASGFSLAHTIGMSTGVVPREQNRGYHCKL